jgi:hypothetical protein
MKQMSSVSSGGNIDEISRTNAQCQHWLWHVQSVQGGEAAGRPIGLIAYLIMGYAVTFLAYTWAESLRLGFAIYGIFDFTSTYMYDGWTIKVRY